MAFSDDGYHVENVVISFMSSEKRPGWLFDIGDEILPNYMGIIISQYKDPYETTSTMESKRFFFVAHIIFSPSLGRTFPLKKLRWVPGVKGGQSA